MNVTIKSNGTEMVISTLGAEPQSLKRDGIEYIWQGDPAVWPRRAPILFPYCGKLVNGSFPVEGKTYAGGQHGFARDLEHEFLGCDGTALRFRLASSAETLALFPFDFVLESTYALEGRTLRHTLAVTNSGAKELRFGIVDGRTRTLEEVGKEFNVTRERIRQIEAKALRKLRHPSRSKKLRDFLN